MGDGTRTGKVPMGFLWTLSLGILVAGWGPALSIFSAEKDVFEQLAQKSTESVYRVIGAERAGRQIEDVGGTEGPVAEGEPDG